MKVSLKRRSLQYAITALAYARKAAFLSAAICMMCSSANIGALANDNGTTISDKAALNSAVNEGDVNAAAQSAATKSSANGSDTVSNVLAPPPVVLGTQAHLFRSRKPHLILVLGGGAGKSVSQLGVIRSLEKHHIPIDAVVGTSMGAMIGSLYCAGTPLNEIENLFLDNKVHHTIMSGIIAGTIWHPAMKLVYLATGRPYAGASKGTAYLDLLKKHLPPTFDQLKIPFAAVATNITDGKTCVLTSGDLPKSVLASCSVPMLFRPVQMNGKLYVDGGLRANLPATIAQDLGDGVVVAVLCDTAIKPVQNKIFKSKSATLLRITDIMLAAADNHQADDTDVLIYPNVDFLPPIPKHPEELKRAINVGEAAADEAIPKIQSKLAAFEAKSKNDQLSAKDKSHSHI